MKGDSLRDKDLADAHFLRRLLEQAGWLSG